MTPDQRILARIPDAELERRWSLARAAMQERDVDVIIMQNNSDWLGGYVRWFTDIPATNGYPRTVIFPISGPMTVVEMGPFDGRRELDGADRLNRGVGLQLTAPSFLSINYTQHYDADLALEALSGARKVGWIGKGRRREE